MHILEVNVGLDLVASVRYGGTSGSFFLFLFDHAIRLLWARSIISICFAAFYIWFLNFNYKSASCLLEKLLSFLGSLLPLSFHLLGLLRLESLPLSLLFIHQPLLMPSLLEQMKVCFSFFCIFWVLHIHSSLISCLLPRLSFFNFRNSIVFLDLLVNLKLILTLISFGICSFLQNILIFLLN